INRHNFNTHFTGTLKYPQGNLTTVGDQYLFNFHFFIHLGLSFSSKALMPSCPSSLTLLSVMRLQVKSSEDFRSLITPRMSFLASRAASGPAIKKRFLISSILVSRSNSRTTS